MFEQSQGEYAYMPMNPKPEENIIQECREFLQNSRCLIVIDGLRSREQWDSIKSLIDGSSKCCILVVTAEENVAKYCAVQDDAAVHRVNALGSEAALEIFKQVCDPLLINYSFYTVACLDPVLKFFAMSHRTFKHLHKLLNID